MPPRDANWIDGLRGVASFVVVCGHLCTSFVPHLHSPAPGKEEPPELFQLPFLRLCVGGRAAVALFFLITGYVNSIGPIAKARAGNHEAAFTGMARSALARSGRLVLPTMVATAISWFLAQTNAYHMCKHVDSTWIRQGWHGPSESIPGALYSLLHAEVETWTTGWDEYDGTQWTLHLFLEGAMIVYTTMLACVMVRPRARKLVFVILYLYAWASGQRKGLAQGPLKTMNLAVGMFMAELHNEYRDQATSILPTPVPGLLILLGMFMSGFPQDNWDRAGWSDTMAKGMTAITPADSDIRRYWDSLGASFLLIGIFFSGPARRLLTSPAFNFLGRVSFPVYLLHNTLIKSVLTWLLYLPSAMHPPTDDRGQPQDLRRPGPLHTLCALAVFYYLLYRAAALWVAHVDPWCARLTNRAVAWAYGSDRGAGSALGPPPPLPHANGASLPLGAAEKMMPA